MPLARCGIRCGSKRVPRGSANGPGSGLGCRKYLRSRGPSGPPRSGESGKNGSTSVETTGHLSMRGLRGSANGPGSSLGCRCHFAEPGPARAVARSGTMAQPLSRRPVTCRCALQEAPQIACDPVCVRESICGAVARARVAARAGKMAPLLSRRPVTCRCAI